MLTINVSVFNAVRHSNVSHFRLYTRILCWLPLFYITNIKPFRKILKTKTMFPFFDVGNDDQWNVSWGQQIKQFWLKMRMRELGQRDDECDVWQVRQDWRVTWHIASPHVPTLGLLFLTSQFSTMQRDSAQYLMLVLPGRSCLFKYSIDKISVRGNKSLHS